jgi:hypothetical protein
MNTGAVLRLFLRVLHQMILICPIRPLELKPHQIILMEYELVLTSFALVFAPDKQMKKKLLIFDNAEN